MNSSAKSTKPEPTKSELEILRILWSRGPLTVREVNNELFKEKTVNYTTTLKLMQIMADKNILKRDESQMKHIYSVVEAEKKTKGRILDKFIDTMYKGSANNLIIHLLDNRKASKEELDEIRKMITKLEE